MGNGIAQACASAGFDVVLMEVAEEPLKRGVASITKSLDKFVEKGKLTQADRNATIARIKPTTKVADLAGCDLIIEAIVENVEVKAKLFAQLDELLAPSALSSGDYLQPMHHQSLPPKPNALTASPAFTSSTPVPDHELVRGRQDDRHLNRM